MVLKVSASALLDVAQDALRGGRHVRIAGGPAAGENKSNLKLTIYPEAAPGGCALQESIVSHIKSELGNYHTVAYSHDHSNGTNNHYCWLLEM